ncbi:MAG: flagellar hook-length control protein FliK [Myxococcales bacterium]|nr:flagellar hook-length control protein FliK [Myxococcales bacterium]
MTPLPVGPVTGAQLQLSDSNRNLPDLALGTRLAGHVASASGAGRGEIVLTGLGRFDAVLTAELAAGDAFVAVVESTAHPLRLRVLAREAGIELAALVRRAFLMETRGGALLRAFSGRGAGIMERVPSLRHWMFGDGRPLDAEGLARALATIADPVEARVHRAALGASPAPSAEGDLFTELRALVKRLEVKASMDPSDATSELLREARALMAETEASQILRALGQARGHGLVVGFPLVVGTEEGFLQLRVRPDASGRRSDRPSGVDFDVRLELSRLGDVRTTGHLVGTELHVAVEVEHAELADVLDAAREELAEALGRVGIPNARIEIRVGPVADRAAWLAGILPPRTALVNLKA